MSGELKWRGRTLTKMGDIGWAIDSCKTPEEAQEFMALYRAHTEHADSNIGYYSGYYGREDMARIQEWFGVAHPVFGKSVPSPEEAFAMGRKMVTNPPKPQA